MTCFKQLGEVKQNRIKDSNLICSAQQQRQKQSSSIIAAAAYAIMQQEQVGICTGTSMADTDTVERGREIESEIIFNVSDKSYNPFPCQDA